MLFSCQFCVRFWLTNRIGDRFEIRVFVRVQRRFGIWGFRLRLCLFSIRLGFQIDTGFVFKLGFQIRFWIWCFRLPSSFVCFRLCLGLLSSLFISCYWCHNLFLTVEWSWWIHSIRYIRIRRRRNKQKFRGRFLVLYKHAFKSR